MAPASPSELRAMLPALLDEIDRAGSIVVGTHVNPDGDALGSALAFSFALDQLGKKHDVLLHHDPPRNLMFMPGVERIVHSPAVEIPDLAIILDLEAGDRLGSTVRPTFDAAKRKVVIDHHVPHEKPGDLRIVSTASPATCAILADLFLNSSVKVTPDMATCLLTGIVTDTGSFRFPNTTAHSMHVAAELLELGAVLPQIIEEVYMRRSYPSVRLTGEAVHRMKLDLDGRLAWTTLPYELFDEHQATDEDTEGIVNDLLAIETVEAAVLLREPAPGKIRGSLRSRKGHDMAAVAREFGGGGHVNAAGVSFQGAMSVAEDQLIQKLRECLVSS